MNEFALARVLHVLGVVLWIGGVAFVTTVLLPAVRDFRSDAERVDFFENVESRFARQARLSTLLTGASGFWLTSLLGGWGRFGTLAGWWMAAMTVVWAVFTLMLFVLEPLVLHRWFRDQARRDPRGIFARIVFLHRVLLGISLITVAGAVAGSHGWLIGV